MLGKLYILGTHLHILCMVVSFRVAVAAADTAGDAVDACTVDAATVAHAVGDAVPVRTVYAAIGAHAADADVAGTGAAAVYWYEAGLVSSACNAFLSGNLAVVAACGLCQGD